MEQSRKKILEVEDIPFGPPPMEYSYRCFRCRHEMSVNEAIIDLELAKAEDEGIDTEEFMPVLGCPNCNREAMVYAGD
jgi:transcription elongation factor Elf1